MPKSGSVYLVNTLTNILKNWNFTYLGNEYALIDQINLNKARTFFNSDAVLSSNHLAPSSENINILRHFGATPVIHLRDPRSALLSWVHHLDRVTKEDENSELCLYTRIRVPPGYFKTSLSEKIDFHIEQYLPDLVSWTKKWLEIHDSSEISSLITYWHELKYHEKHTLRRILHFNGINYDENDLNLSSPEKSIEMSHYRKGEDSEWIDVFTKSQQIKCEKLIPVDIINRVNSPGSKNIKKKRGTIRRLIERISR